MEGFELYLLIFEYFSLSLFPFTLTLDQLAVFEFDWVDFDLRLIFNVSHNLNKTVTSTKSYNFIKLLVNKILYNLNKHEIWSKNT